MMVDIAGTRQRGRPKKTRLDCIRGDMESFGVYNMDDQTGN